MQPIVPKPPGEAWTEDQWQAIHIRDSHVLVAAAAGSGKTAVLVERIIRRITAETDPLDVDRLLVATFTNAAAAEMRQRIREALESELEKKPDSAHVRKQIALIQQASITTIHAFCLEVIRRYFQLIPLDPGFRIANETEAELLRQEVLERLLESRYEESGESGPFWKMLDWFGGDRSDDELLKMISRVYDYARSHPLPEHWLRRSLSLYASADDPNGGGAKLAAASIWSSIILQDVDTELSGVRGLLEDALKLGLFPGGPYPYVEQLKRELQIVGMMLEAARKGKWDSVYEAFQQPVFANLKPCRGDDFDKALQQQAKDLRDQAKKRVIALKEELFQRPLESYLQEAAELEPLMGELVELVLDFGSRFAQAKAEKGLVDFSDLEHYCLRVLSDPDSPPGDLRPSFAALEYSAHFAEVLLDEYQDTNLVQESIARLITRDNPGNRFMVGDVKQSIYRFRLADPGLFQKKYKDYAGQSEVGQQGSEAGIRIDLSQNFRSRKHVVDAVNFIFRQIMNEGVAEIEYDDKAELKCGAAYPDAPGQWAEILLIDRAAAAYPDSGEEDGTGVDEGADSGDDEAGEFETVQLEARAAAAKIRGIVGLEGKPALVFDKRQKALRPASFRDVVILLRSTQQWAPVFMEELRAMGIPAYAELNTGYFSATEVETVLSLLKVIDNPLQDIPLAAVLRSPLVGLTAEELALIRIAEGRAPYFEALQKLAAEDSSPRELKLKAERFLTKLEQWRRRARQGALSDLIWSIYRETGYYDLIGGFPGGMQRQANLRALYDRARQYESTSLRGLFRFLRFIERMRDSGGDLGTARALGEQEDVVRIMTIHKSKGLEFPVVFVAGLNKSFNRQDLRKPFLLHKELGFGPKIVDAKLRISYPSLPNLAIKRRMEMELLAEEMRILYVALTRAREKLILLGTVNDLQKSLQQWGRHLQSGETALPAETTGRADCYLDWIGPALIRHPQAAVWRAEAGLDRPGISLLENDDSRWQLSIVRTEQLTAMPEAAAGQENEPKLLEALRELKPVPLSLAGGEEDEHMRLQAEIDRRMNWQYPFAAAQGLYSKTSVTELKRLGEHMLLHDEAAAASLETVSGPPQEAFETAFIRRPRFMEEKKLSPAERGTAYHAVMQHVELKTGLAEDDIAAAVQAMVAKELLSEAQGMVIDVSVLSSFFTGELGRRMLASPRIMREVPFSYAIAAGEVYATASSLPQIAEEPILIQGVIDCIFEENGEWVLVDYKTDAVKNRPEAAAAKYRLQIDIYTRAIESIWNKRVKEKILFFFDGSHTVRM